MYLIKGIDCLGKNSGSAVIVDDIKDIGNIVAQITSSKVPGNLAMEYALNMEFGDKFVDYIWGYSIHCFGENIL